MNILFNPIEVGRQTPVFPPARRLLHQPCVDQIIHCPLYGRAGEADPCGYSVDARPAGALFVGMVFEIDKHSLCPGTQLTVLIDRIVISQSITSHCWFRLRRCSAS